MSIVGTAEVRILADDGEFTKDLRAKAAPGLEALGADAEVAGAEAGGKLGKGLEGGVEGAYQDAEGKWHNANGKFISAAEATGMGAGGGIERGVKDGLDKTEREVEQSGARSGGKLTSSFSKGLSGLSSMLGLGFLDPVSKGVDKAGEHMEEAGGKTSGFMGKLQNLGGGIAIGAAVGLAAVSAEGIKLGMTMESTDSHIAAAGDTSQRVAKQIGDAFLGTAGTTTFSGQEMATAYAGVVGQLTATQGHALNASQALDVMKASTDAAEASGEDLQSVTGGLAKVMQAYHLDASQAAAASDTLYNASKATGTGIGGLAGMLGKMHTALGENAPSLQQSSALLVDFAKHGVTGRGAISALSSSLTSLVDPTVKQQQALKLMGVSLTDANGKFIGIGPAMDALKGKLGENGNALDAQAAKTLFSGKTLAQIQPIIEAGGAAFDKEAGAVNRAGSAHEGAEKASANLHATMEKLEAAVKDAVTQWGEKLIPIVTKVGTVLAKVALFILDHKAILIALAAVVGGIVVTAFVAWAASLWATVAAATVLGAPVLAVAAAIAAVIAVIVLLATNWKAVWGEVKRIFFDAWDGIMDAWHAVLHFFEGIPGMILGALKDLGKDLVRWIKDALKLAYDAMIDYLKLWYDLYIGLPMKLIGYLARLGGDLVHWIAQAWGLAYSALVGALSAWWGFVSSIPQKIINGLLALGAMLLGWIRTAWGYVTSGLTTAFDATKGFVAGIPAKIIDALKGLGKMLLTWITDAWNLAKGWVEKAANLYIQFWTQIPLRVITAVANFGSKLLTWITQAWNTFTQYVTAAWSREVAFWSAIPGQVIGAVASFGGMILGWITDAWNGFTSFVTTAWNKEVTFWSGLPGKILAALGNGLTVLAHWGEDLVTGIVNGIGSVADKIGKALLNAVMSGVNAVKNGLNSIPVIGSVFSSIPGLAEGGYVTKPTLALVGEAGPEYVIPAKTLKAQYAAGIRPLSSAIEPGPAGATSTSTAGGQTAGGITLHVENTVTVQGNADQATIDKVKAMFDQNNRDLYQRMRAIAG